jgi:propanediol dehydratase large subunit
MEVGIPVLTDKGKAAIVSMPADLTARCRNILVQVDGKRTLDEIRTLLRGLDGLEDAIQKLIKGGFVQVAQDCRDVIKEIIQRTLGNTAPSLLKKIDELHAKHGENCWQHIGELDKAARLFYGEVVADKLKAEITQVLSEAKV